MIQRLYLRIFATTVRLWLIGLRVRLLYGPCRVFAVFFFFFQAEDGIRDIGVTGVQTCALPISAGGGAGAAVTGGANVDVAGAADLVIVAVPYAGHADTLAELATPLAGKVVVDCVVPMAFDELGAYVLDVPEGSVAQQAAALLPDSHVVGAFHHLSARLLEDLSTPTLDGDVMVVGDVREATDTVQALAGRLPGMRGIYAGRLRNARQVEALTINLVSVNRRYKAHAGIRVTDV